MEITKFFESIVQYPSKEQLEAIDIAAGCQPNNSSQFKNGGSTTLSVVLDLADSVWSPKTVQQGV